MQAVRIKHTTGLSMGKDDAYLASHLVVLGTCVFILIGGFILDPVHLDTHNTMVGGRKLPELCIFKCTFGIPCPGCGLVRSIVAALHGDWILSLYHHPLGLLTIAYLILQILHKSWLIVVSTGKTKAEGIGYYLDRGLIVLMMLFFITWIPVIYSMVYP